MELFIFIVFQLLMEVQSYKFPRVKVSPEVIRESSSVKISCETDPHVSVSECHFFINREEKKKKSSLSCELDLTGAEVFRWAAVKSPESLNIVCYYTMTTGLSSFISSPESDPVTVSTSTTTEQTTITAMKTLLSVMSTSETTTYSKTTDLQTKINLPTSTGKETKISTSTTTEQTTSTAMKTSLTLMSTSETTTYSKTADLQTKINVPTSTGKEKIKVQPLFLDEILLIVLVSIGVTVILSGLIGLICLCRFACKKRRKPDAPIQETGISCSGPPETHSLITSVPETSQPISAGLEHPESHQDSTADPTKHITSVNVLYQPSDVLINKQQKQGNPEEKKNVYHLYSTIPENQFTQMQTINPTVC